MMYFKTLIKSRYPALTSAWYHMRNSIWKLSQYVSLSGKHPAQVFDMIYRENKWGDSSTRSGPGSNFAQTEVIRGVLPQLIVELNCKSLLDVPCGDFYWMNMIKMDLEYIGGDIVVELIETNQKIYGNENRRFILLDITQDRLPKSDLILCRDCLVHLSNSHIFRALANIKVSGSTYFLATTFVDRNRNDDIPTGSWRPINLQLSPFNFPTPMRLINEKSPQQDALGKSLGLWKISDISIDQVE